MDRRRVAPVSMRSSVKVVRRSPSLTQDIVLEAPVVDSAALAPVRGGVSADGLLKESIRNGNLIISIPFVTGIAVDYDAFQLFVDGQPFSAPTVITAADETNGKTDIIIPSGASIRREKLSGFPYIVRYRLRKLYTLFPDGEYIDYAGQIQYIVDLTAPGPHLSVPFIAKDIVDSGLTPAVLDQLGDKVPAEIYSYGFQAQGDNVYLLVDSYVSAPITRTDTGPLLVDYPRALIEQADDGEVEFKYRVEDRAGNQSSVSDPVVIRVLLKIMIDDLVAPEVPVFTTNAVILDDDARAGVLVEIPLHAKLEEGDEIVVVWGGREQTRVQLASADLTDPLFGGAGNGIKVPYPEVLASLAGAERGTVEVAYKVLRGGLDIGTSDPLQNVLVDLTLAGGKDPDPTTPEHELLVPLTILSDSGESNVIPPDDFKKNATAIIPWENTDRDPVFVAGDEIQVWWDGVAALATPYPVSGTDVTDGKDLNLPVQGAVMTASNPALPVWYTVTRALVGPPDDQTNTSLSPRQPVDVQSKADLPGGNPGLLAGDFPDAAGVVGNRAIIIATARGGTVFRVSAYLNQADGDTVDFEAKRYDRPTGGTEIDPPLTLTKKVSSGQEQDPVDFPVPQSFFFIPEWSGQVGRVEVTYTVTQDKANPTPVQSAPTRAIVDVRNWTP